MGGGRGMGKTKGKGGRGVERLRDCKNGRMEENERMGERTEGEYRDTIPNIKVPTYQRTKYQIGEGGGRRRRGREASSVRQKEAKSTNPKGVCKRKNRGDYGNDEMGLGKINDGRKRRMDEEDDQPSGGKRSARLHSCFDTFTMSLRRTLRYDLRRATPSCTERRENAKAEVPDSGASSPPMSNMSARGKSTVRCDAQDSMIFDSLRTRFMKIPRHAGGYRQARASGGCMHASRPWPWSLSRCRIRASPFGHPCLKVLLRRARARGRIAQPLPSVRQASFLSLGPVQSRATQSSMGRHGKIGDNQSRLQTPGKTKARASDQCVRARRYSASSSDRRSQIFHLSSAVRCRLSSPQRGCCI